MVILFCQQYKLFKRISFFLNLTKSFWAYIILWVVSKNSCNSYLTKSLIKHEHLPVKQLLVTITQTQPYSVHTRRANFLDSFIGENDGINVEVQRLK